MRVVMLPVEGHEMYERFTEMSRKAMELANQEARRFNHEYIGTEHLLLGLIQIHTGVAANVFKSLGIDLRKIRLEVEKVVQPGSDRFITTKLPVTPKIKNVLAWAVKEAEHLNHYYVATEHLLLGLLREEEGVAAIILNELGLTLEVAREQILTILHHSPLFADGGELAKEKLCLPAGAVVALQAAIEQLSKDKVEAVEEQDFERATRLREQAETLTRLLAYLRRHERRAKKVDVRRRISEYDLFLPLQYNDGSPVESEKIARLKKRLADQFGGLTFFPQRNEGTWRFANVIFREDIVILRVLTEDRQASRQFLLQLKEELKADLRQELILIVERQAKLL